MLYKDIEKLVKLLESSKLDELEWEKNKERVRLKKSPTGAVAVSAPMPAAAPAPAPAPVAASTPAPAAAGPAPAPVAAAANGSGKEVSSPFVGTFYESPAPGAPKYVQVGQTVNKGDVLCIIEAMKIMNEIEAEFSGKVSEILVKDGQAVQFGQPIFLVDPS